MGDRIRVLSPVGEARKAAFSVPGLPASLSGTTVGFLDNTKANFDRLVVEIEALLRERFGVKAVVHRRKANLAIPAPKEMLEELARSCDLVFAGSAD